MKRRLRKLVRDLLPIAVTVLVVLMARSSFADHYVVPSSSMENTLFPGDRVLVDKTAYGLRAPFAGWQLTDGDTPERGEVVVFDSPVDGTRLIKRVVAVGGDTVAVRGGHLLIDGRPAGDPRDPSVEVFGERTASLNLAAGGGPDIGPVHIPTGSLLVMGDYRGNSFDGRSFGLISADTVYGRGIAVFHRSGEGFVWRPL